MIKIDLHIHTIASNKDASFEFCADRLRDYVKVRQIDCIAITNHNLFDENQFLEIQKALSITVLPGIEIDLEEGQILVIADGAKLSDFTLKCQLVSNACLNNQDSLTLQQFKTIFSDLSEYILIPHYEKKPKLSPQNLDQLKPHVTAGEVASPKKFIYCLKEKGKLVPVYFSDFRSANNCSVLPFRQTYLNCDEKNFAAVKNCLRDKGKVSLSPTESKDRFLIFENGQELSAGLNVIIGERSSGKSYTLNLIRNHYPNCRFIEQFSLVARDEEADQKKFNKLLAKNHSLLSREYLDELQNSARDIMDVNVEEDSRCIDKYISSLLKHAKESERQDAFSKAKLYNEEAYETLVLKGLRELIASTQNLIENEEFKEIVERHISKSSLKKLIVELMQEYGRREQERLKKTWLNELIQEIKDKLQVKTAVTKIEELNLYSVAMNQVKLRKFNEVVKFARKKRRIMQKALQGFEIVADAGVFEGAGELKKLGKLKSAFSDAFHKYQNPYEFLQQLKLIEGLEEADYYKHFVKIEFRILNKDGYEVSGGERSEFNLLQELQEAKKFDMLLVDEPESSFDNIFLKEDVNEYIKDISKDIPVVIVTHNSTVGASIKPDYLLYTKKEIIDGGIQYQIYSGCPTDKHLISRDGNSLKTWDILLDCLEAGANTYDERRRGYEDLKN